MGECMDGSEGVKRDERVEGGGEEDKEDGERERQNGRETREITDQGKER